ncbi:alpha/beta hydrolase [Paractinoplanes deccanensis]
MNRTRLWHRFAALPVLALAAAVLPAPAATAATATAAAPPEAVLELPEPGGPYRVGVTDLHLVDRHRADPWVPERRRELMVSLWFPAASRGGTPDRYVSAAESRAILTEFGMTDVPADLLSGVRVHARTGVRPLARPGGWPLVVLSPGFSQPRSSLTSLAEDLASRGYVVAGVDHTYEAAAVTFPDGRVAGCSVCRLEEAGKLDQEYLVRGRAQDISFVLDELTRRRTGVRVDADRIAVVGYSVGGAAAAAAIQRDRRIDAGANIDGTFFPAITKDLGRPFLMIGSDLDRGAANDPTWAASWAHLTGWRRWLTVTGSTHGSFPDYGVIGDQLGLPSPPLSGERATEITRQYVAAFAGRHLRHHPSPLLNGPSADYPEVVFER